MASLAEAGTLQLEFKYLSHLTGDYTYWDKVERVGIVFVRQSDSLGQVDQGIGYARRRVEDRKQAIT
jgi:hypothetical protein